MKSQQIQDAKLGMHNGPEFLLESVEFVKKPELSLLEKPFKVFYTNGKVDMQQISIVFESRS